MTISDIPVGGLLVFGAYSVQGRVPPAELLWVKLSQQNDFCTAHVIDMVQFDDREPSCTTNKHRAASGNSCYWESNVDQWLNSAEENWFHPTTPFDAAPTLLTATTGLAMSDRAGFLKDFQPHELEIMQERQIVCKVPFGRKKDFDADRVTISRKVALPSSAEFLGFEPGMEGPVFEFSTETTPSGARRMKFLPSDEFADFYRVGNFYSKHYFLRTPVLNSPSKVYVVDTNGVSVSEKRPMDTAGLLPIIRLSGDAEISIEPGSEFVHCLTASLNQRINHFDELMTLLC